MTMAEPVATFIETYAKELDGKTIIPFSTNGGYGLGSSIDYIETILAENQVTARIEPAFAVEGNRVDQADSDLMTWYDNLNKQKKETVMKRRQMIFGIGVVVILVALFTWNFS